MRVLVTGATGFVGGAVARTLVSAGHEVVSMTRSASEVDGTPVRADLRDREALAEVLANWEFDGVCHLAALTRVRDSFADPVSYFDVNVSGTANLLAALSRQKVAPRVVLASTGAVYGGQVEGALAEGLPVDPGNPYAASKVAAEQLLKYTAAGGSCSAIALRCFSISGAYGTIGDRDPTRIIPNALRAADGRITHVELNGDGAAIREFTHVLDVADVYRAAIEVTPEDHWRAYNVGVGHGVPIREVIDLVAERTGRHVPVTSRPAVPEPAVLVADSTRARAELGWKPTRSELSRIIDDAWNARQAGGQTR